VTTSAAFFDLDRTLMSGTSAYYFAKAAYREGLLPRNRMAADSIGALVFKLFGASDEQSQALRDRILATVAGTRAEYFHRLVPGVVEELLGRIKPESQALLDMHAEAGRDIYIISASPVEIVRELAAALDLTGGLGTQSEIVDDVYTGRLAAPFAYGEGKADIVRKLVADRGYELAHCYAYADSGSDLPILSLVGHPVAVNPDRALEAVAHRRGWPIVEFNRERKQVVKVVSGAAFGLAAASGGFAAGHRRGHAVALGERRRWRGAVQEAAREPA
jgi:HAD superfamily hydrolase (TIGR01490 family)